MFSFEKQCFYFFHWFVTAFKPIVYENETVCSFSNLLVYSSIQRLQNRGLSNSDVCSKCFDDCVWCARPLHDKLISKLLITSCNGSNVPSKIISNSILWSISSVWCNVHKKVHIICNISLFANLLFKYHQHRIALKYVFSRLYWHLKEKKSMKGDNEFGW